MSVPRRRSLTAVLARRWIAYGWILSAAFAGLFVLVLFLLEDTFIDRRLREVAATPMESLPAGFSLESRATMPPDVAAATAGQAPGTIREFRRDDGRYVHALAQRGNDGRETLLLYDVSDQLYVNAALRTAWPYVIGAALLLAALAWLLAYRLTRRVADQARNLALAAVDAPDPSRLRALAADTDIAEFAELANLAASTWEAKLGALARERETLVFLGHELRTPLQSARTNIELLREGNGNEQAWQRLQRAQDRLARASVAILWLAGDANPRGPPECAPSELLGALVAEFAPLADSRGQRIEVDASPSLRWPMHAEVAETVLANLLQNAIQHGETGTIYIRLESVGLTARNPQAAAPDGRNTGFGIGLVLVARLLERAGWTLAQHREAGHFVVVARHAVTGTI